ncbi:MAG: hypothetical protein BWY89_00294 [Bacteroidetes bacterium ADurb.BinA012]|nr:MAG: hypothetical protein BWY89_00294 [Bacteroidetes bacterium ADurb.BinA012]
MNVSETGLIFNSPVIVEETLMVTGPAGAFCSQTSMVAVDPSVMLTAAGENRMTGRSSSAIVISAGVASTSTAGVPETPVMVTLTVSSPSTRRSAMEVSVRSYDSAPAGITNDPARAT